jgi:hypothetical protein
MVDVSKFSSVMVEVSKFSSVLETAFSVSFIFFFFQVSPLLKKRSSEISNACQNRILSERLRARVVHRNLMYAILILCTSCALTGSRILFWILEAVLFVFTLASALGSLALLIWVGFDEDLKIH